MTITSLSLLFVMYVFIFVVCYVCSYFAERGRMMSHLNNVPPCTASGCTLAFLCLLSCFVLWVSCLVFVLWLSCLVVVLSYVCRAAVLSCVFLMIVLCFVCLSLSLPQLPTSTLPVSRLSCLVLFFACLVLPFYYPCIILVLFLSSAWLVLMLVCLPLLV